MGRGSVAFAIDATTESGKRNGEGGEILMVDDDEIYTALAKRDPPKALAPQEILRLGALTLHAEQSEAVEHLLMDQRHIYEDSSKHDLIEALLARDRALANMGRQVADGRTASRLLREFMRAALYAAEGKADPQVVERALNKLGAEPADARTLKLHGSTLGPLEDPAERAEGLASGRVKE
jgi:hypothetical protein